MAYQEVLKFAKALALDAAQQMAEMRSSLAIEFKHGTELVTQADLAVDQLINDRISKTFPNHSVLSEELGPGNDTEVEHLWIVDPIDGTVNYAHGHAQSAVSIAYYHKGIAQVGVVANLFAGETFTAIRGGGAFLNDQPIHCSDKQQLNRALVATGFPYEKDNLAPLLARLDKVLHNCADIRRLGAASLDICWVACGRMDIYYESVKPWDFAAAQLIAREAGATVGHIHDLPLGSNPELYSEDLLIATPALFAPMQALLREVDQSSRGV